MHNMCHHPKYILHIHKNNEHTDFHMKHIAQVKVLSKHTSKTCGGVMLRDPWGSLFL
jgi:hypothetical protein